MSDSFFQPDDLEFEPTQKGLVDGLRVFDRYRVKGKLGRGGMGIVWRAHDEVLDRDVALKFLPEVICTDRAALDELKRETRRGQDLAHPHIVRIYDFVGGREVGGDAAIAMEYIDGDTLSGVRVDRPGRVFSCEEIAPWLGQLCEALTYAHTHAKIVHRDLKPANLMINRAGQLKITDFGIARSISDSVSRMSVQQGGDTSGTLAYMSPQQADGNRPSPLDDIYSTGAVIYEMLTGKPPFHSGEIYQQVHNKVPPRMGDRRRDLDVPAADTIPEAWEKAVAACLAKDSAQRPQSAAALWEALNQQERKPATRKSKLPALAAGLILLAALGGAGWWFGYEQPRQKEISALKTQAAAEEKSRLEAAAEAQRQQEAATAAARAAADKKKAEETAAEQARIATAKQQLITETQNLAQKALAAKQWSQAESIADKLASLDPQNAQIVVIRQSATSGLEAQRAAEERARANPADLPASGFFTLAENFAPSAYAAYNSYTQGQILNRAQDKMKSAGYYSGTSDGEAGKGTTDALVAFQRATPSLNITGRLDPATLAVLGLAGLSEMAPPTPTPRPKPAATARPKPASTPKPAAPSSGGSGFFKDSGF